MTSPFAAAVRSFRETGDAAALIAQMPYTAFVGLETQATKGDIVSILRSRPGNIGNTQIRAVHGGVVGALLEHAAIMQVFYQTESEHTPKTINITIDYLRPCLADKDTFATARVVKHGRRVANVRIEAYQGDASRPIAAAHAHFLLG